MNELKKITLLALVASISFFSACDDDDVPEFNEEEIITDVILNFTPQDGGDPIIVTAQDPDGEGPEDIAPTGTINLNANTTYDLKIELLNSVANESITEEVEQEADEHLFLFSWSDELFTDPDGNGNIDNRTDPLNYNDEDINGLDLGLSSTYTTNDPATGQFRVVLKHQPEIKSATSSITDGETDVDITWNVQVN